MHYRAASASGPFFFPLIKTLPNARARLVPVFKMVAYPLSLLEAFVGTIDDRSRYGRGQQADACPVLGIEDVR